MQIFMIQLMYKFTLMCTVLVCFVQVISQSFHVACKSQNHPCRGSVHQSAIFSSLHVCIIFHMPHYMYLQGKYVATMRPSYQALTKMPNHRIQRETNETTTLLALFFYNMILCSLKTQPLFLQWQFLFFMEDFVQMYTPFLFI